MRDVVARMDWRRVVPWKVDCLAACGDKPLVPIGYGFGDFPREVERGSRIWVVTRRSRREPYTLLARLRVREVCRPEALRNRWPPEAEGLLGRWRKIAVAHAGASRFYPTNDARADLRALGVRFRGPFCYVEGSGRPFSAAVRHSRRTVFLSYKWIEEKEFAFALAAALLAEKLSPWFDGLAIPDYREAKNRRMRRRLDELLRRGIADSRLAVVINSRSFGRAGYTAREWRQIRRGGGPAVQVLRGGRRRRRLEAIPDGPPARVAAAIRQAYERSRGG